MSVEQVEKLTAVEGVKEASNHLRGTILEGLADISTGAIADDDTHLTKFHGIYQQDDRDLRNERRRQKLERAFFFMCRVGIPGGICTPDQWLTIDHLSDRFGNGTIKLTTRQAFQLHGVLKGSLQPTIAKINEALMTTLSACGDVNRNVMCNPNPYQSEVHREVYDIAGRISAHLKPKTRAYHEIWIDGEKIVDGNRDEEPIYGKSYLPRKFKIAVAVPPSNDVDIFTQDLGFIAILEDGKLVGFNITAGGGMGTDHGKKNTFPRLGDTLGSVDVDQVLAVAEAVVTTQRDFGNRSNRKRARLKYTIEDRGLDWFIREVEGRAGVQFAPVRPVTFSGMADRYGWSRGTNGRWHLNLFIQNGRVKDEDGVQLKSGLQAIARVHRGDFRLTPNQNLIIANIDESDKTAIEELVKECHIDAGYRKTGLRLNSLACVALPTCGLALAEGERLLPEILVDLERIFDELGLRDDAVTIRMTGCPNGCARPYTAEIGLVGRGPGRYNLYLGAAFDGTRLNKLYRQAVPVGEIADTLRPVLEHYARERDKDERFGDFCIRFGYITALLAGRNFHDQN